MPTFSLIVGGQAIPPVTKPPPRNDLTARIHDQFDAIDKDGDGFLSETELDEAVENPAFTADDAAMVATLRKRQDDFEEMSDDELLDENDGITRADVTTYDRVRAADPDNEGIKLMEHYFLLCKTKLAAQNRSLVDASGVLDFNSVKQGFHGDCWFLAALVGAVARDEASVRAMLVPDPDDPNITLVSIPGAPVKPAKVPPLTDAEICTYASAGSNGLWLSVFEKGFAVALNESSFFLHNSTVVGELGRTFLHRGIAVITGSSVDTDVVSLTLLSTIRDKIEGALTNGRIVTASIRKHIIADYSADGLPEAHAYTVLAFDRATDIVTIRNPWGSSSTAFSNTFDLTMDQFNDNFSLVAYEEAP